MSAAENKELMERLFAAAAAGDRAPLVAHIADDIVMRVTGRNSWSQTFRGKEA